MHIHTIAVHAGAETDASTGALSPPVHLSTTFEHGPAGEELLGFSYFRDGNPTQSRLEQAMTQLEGGAAALVFASGMAAGAAILQSLAPGSHVIFPDFMYADFRVLCRQYLPRWGIEASFVEMDKTEEVEAAMRSDTRLVWIESPSNPLLKITDIRKVCDIVRSVGAQVLVDNTFATPLLQRPLELGADIVLHATTKYCGGHNDVHGGALILKHNGPLNQTLTEIRRLHGAVASPFASWLVLRGLRSMHCRMEKHCANATAVAAALSRSEHVDKVYYPGLSSHPGHSIAAMQMKDFGGMLSFAVKGGYDEAVRVSSRVKLFTNATSLGGTQSLIEHRASIEGENSKVPINVLRLSLGLEHPDDLIADLRHALA